MLSRVQGTRGYVAPEWTLKSSNHRKGHVQGFQSGKARRWGAAQSPRRRLGGLRRAKASLKQGDGEPPCRLGDALKTLEICHSRQARIMRNQSSPNPQFVSPV